MRFTYTDFRKLKEKFLTKATPESIAEGVSRAFYMIESTLDIPEKHHIDDDTLWGFSCDLCETGAPLFLPLAQLVDSLNTYRTEYVWTFLEGMCMENSIKSIKWYKYKISIDGRKKYDFQEIDEKEISGLHKGVMIEEDGTRFVWCYSKNNLT